MRTFRRTAAQVAAAFVVAFWCFPATAGDIVDNSANAIMLANQAKGLVTRNVTPSNSAQGIDNNQKTRTNRGSAITEYQHDSLGCGGIEIGNVRSSPGDIHQHNPTVIIRGNVINANNRC
jgi:hypothetical protein